MKLVLYTYQHPDAVTKLRCEGALRLKESDRHLTYVGQEDGYQENHFESPYRFMAYEMSKRLPSPLVPCAYPIWAWYKSNGRYRPSKKLDALHHGKVRLRLEIDEKRVLLSDFDRFAYLTCGGLYFELKPGDERYGDNIFLPDEQFYPNWECVFDIHRKNDDDYGWSWRRETIQATFWELFLEDVTETKAV